MALTEKLTAIADAIREKTGSTGKMNLDEMAEMIYAMDAGSGEAATLDNTYILVDEDGNEIPAVLTEEEVALTATAVSDIRAGTTAVTDEGVVTGEKEIPIYHTTEGIQVVTAGSDFTIVNVKNSDFTKLQVLICAFNTNLSDSVSTEKVCINGALYEVKTTVPLSTATSDTVNNQIKLGITNEGSSLYVIRYFTYKEIY